MRGDDVKGGPVIGYGDKEGLEGESAVRTETIIVCDILLC